MNHIFSIFYCLKDAVFESVKDAEDMNTIMFSPSDSNIFAVAGSDGVLFYDVRRPTRLESISISSIANIKSFIVISKSFTVASFRFEAVHHL